jgi:hypothetical protein
VQFEPAALRVSVQRLLAKEPVCMYLTHYGRVEDVPALGCLLLSVLDRMVAVGRRCAHAPQRHERLKAELTALYATCLGEHGAATTPASLDLLAIDIELNAQGLGVWLDREARSASTAT